MIHREITLLIDLRVVTIGFRWRHAFPGIESVNSEADTGFSRDTFGQFANVEDARACGHPELHQCYFLDAQFTREIGAGQYGVGMLLPENEIESHLGAKATKCGNTQRHQVEMQRFRQALIEYALPDIAAAKFFQVNQGHSLSFSRRYKFGRMARNISRH